MTTGGLMVTTPACRWFDETPVTGTPIWTGISAAQPDSLTGLTLWLKADAITGVASGGKLTSWNDNSGLGNHMSEALNPPNYFTNIINGLPVVRFNPASTQRLGRSILGSDVFSTNETDIFIVQKQNAATVATVTLCWYGPPLAYGNNTVLVHLSHTDSLHFYYGANINSLIGAQPTGWDNTFHIVTLTHKSVGTTDPSSNRSQIAINGLLSYLNLVPGQALDTTQTGPLYIGFQDHGAGVNYFDGDIAEIIIYNRKLTDTERRGVELYLSDKYAITLV